MEQNIQQVNSIKIPSIVFHAATGKLVQIKNFVERAQLTNFQLSLDAGYLNRTPLWYAKHNNQITVAKYLESLGATEEPMPESPEQQQNVPPNSVPDFIWYLIIGENEIAKALIEQYKKWIPNFDLNGVFGDEKINPLNCTALCGHIECISMLIELGADINYITPISQRSALHAACTTGQIECIKFLLEKSANKDIEKSGKATPLMIFLLFNNIETIKKGFDYFPINPNQVNSEGFSLLDTVIIFDNDDTTEKIKFLLEKRVNINSQDINGDTALHHEVLVGDQETIRLLLKHNANPKAQNLLGETPLHVAAKHNILASVLALIRFDATAILIKDKEGKTPVQKTNASCLYNILKECELRIAPNNAICSQCNKCLKKDDLYSILPEKHIVLHEDCYQEYEKEPLYIAGNREIKIFKPLNKKLDEKEKQVEDEEKPEEDKDLAGPESKKAKIKEDEDN